MPLLINIEGTTSGRLTVIGYSQEQQKWLCSCSCGKSKYIASSSLRRGATKSCGCLKKEEMREKRTTHNMSDTIVYTRWATMIQRCGNPHDRSYRHYGGRGIKVCASWKKFENFFKDMGHPPKGLELERINNDGDYTPENCTWVTRKEQTNNCRKNRVLTFNGVHRTESQWAEEMGISVQTLSNRINQMGWSIEKAISTPLREKDFGEKISFKGQEHTLLWWSKKLHTSYDTLWKRINKYKWSVDKSLSLPIRKRS
jgi:hypothetical protein